MAHGRSRCFYRRQETLALARRRSGRLCSRRSRSKPSRPESRPPAHAQTAAKDNQGAARHDHGQAALLWRGPQGYGAEGGASPTQGLEQPGGEFASAGAATREDHEALQIGAAQRFLSIHDQLANLFHLPRPERQTATARRTHRAKAIATWREITGAAMVS